MKRILLLFTAIISVGILSAQTIDVPDRIDLMHKIDKLSGKYRPNKLSGVMVDMIGGDVTKGTDLLCTDDDYALVLCYLLHTPEWGSEAIDLYDLFAAYPYKLSRMITTINALPSDKRAMAEKELVMLLSEAYHFIKGRVDYQGFCATFGEMTALNRYMKHLDKNVWSPNGPKPYYCWSPYKKYHVGEWGHRMRIKYGNNPLVGHIELPEPSPEVYSFSDILHHLCNQKYRYMVVTPDYKDDDVNYVKRAEKRVLLNGVSESYQNIADVVDRSDVINYECDTIYINSCVKYSSPYDVYVDLQIGSKDYFIDKDRLVQFECSWPYISEEMLEKYFPGEEVPIGTKQYEQMVNGCWDDYKLIRNLAIGVDITNTMIRIVLRDNRVIYCDEWVWKP